MLAVPVGLLAAAMLIVNNVRDLETDRRAGKRTLAVRLGRRRARVLYALMVYLAFATAPLAWLLGGDGLDAVAAAAAGWRCRSPRRSCGSCATRSTGRRSTARSPARGCSSSRSACCCRPACCCRTEACAVVRPVRYELRVPLRTAWGELHVRELLLVRLEFGDGDWRRGRGRAAGALRRRLAGAPCGRRWTPTREVLARRPEPTARGAAARERDLPQALAAIDLALWDRESRRAGTPVARLIAPRRARRACASTRRSAPRTARAPPPQAAAGASRDGFTTLKVKVGVGDDAGRLAAIRAAVGRDVALRVDANGAWRTPRGGARATCARWSRWASSCARSRSTAWRRCARCASESPVPIAMDETARARLRRRRRSCA